MVNLIVITINRVVEARDVAASASSSSTNNNHAVDHLLTDPENEKSQKKKEKKKSMEQLMFGGMLELQSKPLPPTVTRTSLIKFFQEERSSNFLLISSAGGDRPTEQLPRTKELEEYWRQTCHDTYGLENLPARGDPIYATNTTTKYPGLFQLTTTTINGIKTFIPKSGDSSSSQEMPKYVLNMIAEQQHPKGLPPVVWAFHKICGFGISQDSLEPSGRVQAVSSAVKTDADDDIYALSFSVDIQIKLEFPKSFVRFMPMKKDKLQSMVSNTILRVIKKDIERNLDVMHTAFTNWYGNGSEAKESSIATSTEASSGAAKSEL